MKIDKLKEYDPGLLNDYGGGKVDWWFDYIRSLLKDADEHYNEQIADLYKPPEEVPLTPFGLSLLCDEKEIKEAVYDKEWTKKAKVGWTKEVTPRDYKVAKAQLTKAKLYYEAEKENEIGKIRARIASGLNPPRNVQEEIDCPETHIYYLEGILQGCERMLAKYLGGK